jgi:DNA-binding MarR family transcriptional regulator
VDRIDAVIADWRTELPAALPPTAELSKRVLALARELTAAITAAVAEFGLTMAEYDVLAALRRAGAPYRRSPTELAGDLLLSTGGVTKALHALTARALVDRHPDPADRRRAAVQLTPAGVALAERAVLASTAAQHRRYTATRTATRAATAALRALGADA